MKKRTPSTISNLVLLSLCCIFCLTSNAQEIRSFVCTGFKYNMALKFSSMAEGQINGHFIIMKSHKDTKETDIPFDGNRQSDQFYIRFKRTPPSLNDNTKWTKHSWKIISVDLVDTLQVIFLQKNLETKKWEEVMYEFIEEKEDYSNLSATLALSDKS